MGESRPHPVDVHVGRRLRSRRTMLGMSQEDLGAAVDITFQQIQKYERGLNRIGASRLYEFACILNIDIAYFFDEYDVNAPTDAIGSEVIAKGLFSPDESVNNKEVLVLVRAYYGVSDKQVRKKVLALIKSLSSYVDNEHDDVDHEEAGTQSLKELVSA